MMRLLLPVFFAIVIATTFSLSCGGGNDGVSQGGGSESDEQTLTLTARGTLFTTQLLAVGPNQQVTFEFVNDDEGQQHNVALFRTEVGGDPFFRIEPTIGKQTTQTQFTTPDVGTYFYRCQFHPEVMRGDLVVTQR